MDNIINSLSKLVMTVAVLNEVLQYQIDVTKADYTRYDPIFVLLNGDNPLWYHNKEPDDDDSSIYFSNPTSFHTPIGKFNTATGSSERGPQPKFQLGAQGLVQATLIKLGINKVEFEKIESTEPFYFKFRVKIPTVNWVVNTKVININLIIGKVLPIVKVAIKEVLKEKKEFHEIIINEWNEIKSNIFKS